MKAENAPDPAVQSADQKAVDRVTVRILQARNGYILKTFQGQFVYGSLKEAAQAVVDFYAQTDKVKEVR